MTNELKPLSEAEAKEFEGRRESAAVVQHRCMGCGAWYETAKRNTAFQEAFNCDCGNTLRFTVPAMDGVRQLSNAEVLDLFDPSARLDTGMKTEEAIKRAAVWWRKKGRRLISKEMASRDVTSTNHLPSGICLGLGWDSLTKREKLLVVKCHHHFTVRKPDLIGGADDPFKPQDRSEIN